MNSKLRSLLALCLLATPLGVAAQRNFDDVRIKTTHVAGNVYMLEGAGGNIGVSVGEDGILIIDDQFAPLAPKIEAALARLSKGPLKFVLNTHWHGDHTGGNAHFGRSASIIAHQNVRKRLSKKTGTAKSALPVITFQNGLSLFFNGEEIRMIHLGPGHTDGDSIIHFVDSNVVHMGDLFFSEGFPYIDLGSGGDVEGYVQNVALVLEHLPEGAKVIPGHGHLSAAAGLEAFHTMLKETTDLIKEWIAGGRSLEQAKAKGLPDRWKGWGQGFITSDRWIETLYRFYSHR